MKFVWNTNERLEESDCAGWVLRSQVNLILNCLLNFAILIIGLNNDALLLRYNHLNVHPFVERQEYRVREGLLIVVLGINVYSEGCARIVPKGEALIELDYMVLGTADNGTRIKGVLAEVVEPEGHRISNIATFVLKARDWLSGKLVTRALIELRHLHILLRD